MKILILGDIHAQWKAANKLIRKVTKDVPDITHIIQVGDLCDYWPKDRPGAFTQWNPDTDLPIHWLDGNHDNHAELRRYGKTPNPKLIYQPRGSVLEIEGYRMLFLGGTTSVDKDYRLQLMAQQGQPDIWWPEESITRTDFDRAMAQEGPIDALFTHDRPDCIENSFSNPKDDLWRIGLSDRLALQGVWEHFKPRFCFWGHYHKPESGTHEGTEWVQCPDISDHYPMNYVLWDGENVTLSWKRELK